MLNTVCVCVLIRIWITLPFLSGTVIWISFEERLFHSFLKYLILCIHVHIWIASFLDQILWKIMPLPDFLINPVPLRATLNPHQSNNFLNHTPKLILCYFSLFACMWIHFWKLNYFDESIGKFEAFSIFCIGSSSDYLFKLWISFEENLF